MSDVLLELLPKRPEDLKKLNKEQKLLLLDLIEEKERRLKEQKALYTPNDGQVKVHASSKPQRIVTAGNGGGKTTLLIHELFWHAQGFNPVRNEFIPAPSKSVLLLDSPDKVNNLYIPEALKWFNIEPGQMFKHGKPYITEIVLKNGSCIQFYFQGQEPLVFESIQVDGMIGIDEPCPRWQYVALRRGARVKNRETKILMVGTPIAQAWVRKEIVEPWARGELPDTDCFKFGTAVNADNLSKNYIEDFSRILNDTEKRVRLHGDFYDLSGLALSHLFSRRSHLVEPFDPPAEWPCVLSIDPHPSKAHVAVVVAINRDGEIFYVDEMQRKETPRVFAASLREFIKPYPIADMVCDSLGKMDGSGGEGFKSFIQVLNEEGLRVRSTTWDEKQDEAFIARIQDALMVPEEEDNLGRRVPKLRIFRGCEGIVRDIENVQWQKRKSGESVKPKLDIADTDFLACLKYALATNLNPRRNERQVTRRINRVSSYGINREAPKVRQFRAQVRQFLKKRKKLHNDDF